MESVCECPPECDCDDDASDCPGDCPGDCWSSAAGVKFSVIQRMMPERLRMPSRISINPTESSMLNPSRGGITTPNRIIAEPTRTIVMV